MAAAVAWSTKAVGTSVCVAQVCVHVGVVWVECLEFLVEFAKGVAGVEGAEVRGEGATLCEARRGLERVCCVGVVCPGL